MLDTVCHLLLMLLLFAIMCMSEVEYTDNDDERKKNNARFMHMYTLCFY